MTSENPKSDSASTAKLLCELSLWIGGIGGLLAISAANVLGNSSSRTWVQLVAGGFVLTWVTCALLGGMGIMRGQGRPAYIATCGNLIILVLFFVLGGRVWLQGRHPAYESTYQTISKEVERWNAEVPRMVDAETRIDAVRVLHGRLLEYDYTFVNLDAGDAPEDLLAKAQNVVALIYTNSEDMAVLRENQVSARVRYFGKNGDLIGTVQVP